MEKPVLNDLERLLTERERLQIEEVLDSLDKEASAMSKYSPRTAGGIRYATDKVRKDLDGDKQIMFPQIDLITDKPPARIRIVDLKEGQGAIDRDGDFVVKAKHGVLVFQCCMGRTIQYYTNEEDGEYFSSKIERLVNYKIVEIDESTS